MRARWYVWRAKNLWRNEPTCGNTSFRQSAPLWWQSYKRYTDVLLQRRGKSKANELTTLIANAKATIREQYPDAEQSITD